MYRGAWDSIPAPVFLLRALRIVNYERELYYGYILFSILGNGIVSRT